MAKMFVVVAALCCGLTAGAPASFDAAAARVSSQDTVINEIMVTLQPAIDAAIARALNSFTVSGVSSQVTTGPVGFSGSVGNTNYEGSYGSSQAAFTAGGSTDNSAFYQESNHQSSQYEVSSNAIGQQNSLGAVQQSVDAVQQSAAAVQQSAAAIQQQQAAVAQAGAAKQVQVTGSAVSAVDQQQMVSAVLNALVPSVQAAVQAALIKQQQVSFVSSGNVAAQQQQTLTTTTTNQQQASFQVNAAEETALVKKIIEVLTPSITTSVRKALAIKWQASQVQNTQLAGSAVGSTSFQSGGSALQSGSASFQSGGSALQSGSASFQASSASSSQIDSSRLVSQIITALKPSIALSVSEALSLQQQQQAAFAAAQQQQQQSSFTSSSSGSSSSSSSSGSLSTLFGDGGVHNVKVETPDYKVEYSNGK